MVLEKEEKVSYFKEKWDNLWGITPKVVKVDNFLAKENSVKDIVRDVLSKKGTYVSMAPRSNRYYIVNLSIDIKIMIDGGGQSISASIEGCNHTWNFREKFIEDITNITVDWIELDRDIMQDEYFRNDLTIMNKIKSAIARAVSK